MNDNNTFEFLKAKTNYSVTRIGALYKDFKHDKELNPEGYEANLISWHNIFKTVLNNDFLANSKLTIPHTNPDLSMILLLPVIGKPLSLDLVVNELVDKKLLIPVSTFIDYEEDFHKYLAPEMGLLTYLSPFHWASEASKKTKELLRMFHLSSERYIVWSTLCEFGKTVMTRLNREIDDGIYSSKVFDDTLLLEFIHQNITTNFSVLDLQILIKYLSRDTRDCVAKTTPEGTTIVKFVKDSDISSEDISIAQVRVNIHEISKRMETIESKIFNLNQRISSYPTEKILKDETIKAAVMTLIAQKRHQAKTYQHSSSIYTQLNQILAKIDSASSNVKIFNVLKQSSQTLNSLNAQVNVDEVEELNSDIQEQIHQTNETSEALGSNMEDQDVEDEFNELLSQHQQQERTEEELLNKLDQLKVDDKIIEHKEERTVKAEHTDREERTDKEKHTVKEKHPTLAS